MFNRMSNRLLLKPLFDPMYKVNKPDDKNQRENTYFNIQCLSIYLPLFDQGNQYFMSVKSPTKCSINIEQ